MASRPLSLHHLTMLDATPEELVTTAIEAGYDLAGLRIVSPDTGESFGELIGDPAARRRLQTVAADLPGGIWDVEAVWLRSSTDVEAFSPALDTAAELGARYVLTVGHDTHLGRLTDSLGRFAELAAAAGVALAIEPITYCGISDLPSALALLAAVGRDDVSVLVDALQFFRSGVPLAELAAIPSRLLPYAQIADGLYPAPVGLAALRHEARSERAVPGAGSFDLTGWIAALPPGVPLAVEVPCSAVRTLPRVAAAQLLREAVTGLLHGEDR